MEHDVSPECLFECSKGVNGSWWLVASLCKTARQSRKCLERNMKDSWVPDVYLWIRGTTIELTCLAVQARQQVANLPLNIGSLGDASGSITRIMPSGYLNSLHLFLFLGKRETFKEDQEFANLEKRQQITGELEIDGRSRWTITIV